MEKNTPFCTSEVMLPPVACEEWLGWVFISLNPSPHPVAQDLAPVKDLVGDFAMATYTETFFDTHV